MRRGRQHQGWLILLQGDQLTKGLQQLIRKYDLPFVAFNQGSICHLDNAGTMHFAIDWSKPWTIPGILKQTGVRHRAARLYRFDRKKYDRLVKHGFEFAI